MNLKKINHHTPLDESLTIKDMRQQIHSFFSLNGVKRSYGKRNSVFKINDTANEAFFVESGNVRIYKLKPDGKEVTFQIVNTGEGFGMTELLLECSRGRYAETMCETTLLVIMKEQLFNLFSLNPEHYLKFIFALTQHVIRYQNMVEDLSSLSLREKVIKLLLRLCKEQDRESDCYIIDYPITHKEIAQMVGSSRQTITAILNELRKEGILDWEHKKITIYWNNLSKKE